MNGEALRCVPAACADSSRIQSASGRATHRFWSCQHAQEPGYTCYCGIRSCVRQVLLGMDISACCHYFCYVSKLYVCVPQKHNSMLCSVSSMQQELCGNCVRVSLGCPAVINFNQTPDENSGVQCDVRSYSDPHLRHEIGSASAGVHNGHRAEVHLPNDCPRLCKGVVHDHVQQRLQQRAGVVKGILC